MAFDPANLSSFLRPGRKFPENWVDRRLWVTPEPLHILCSCILDDQSLPEVYSWKNKDVLKWVEKLGFPQYRNTFFENMINGRTLLLLDAPALCRMNIKDFDHILFIAKEIRKLYGVEKILFKRSISLPPRYPMTHYYLYRVYTGPKYELCRSSDLWRKMQILRPKPPYTDHWIELTNWLKHIPNFQTERVGYSPKYRLHWCNKDQPKIVPLTPSYVETCKCMPPCECTWSAMDYSDPWLMTYLAQKQNKMIADGDYVLLEEYGKDDKKKLCNCMPPCQCLWTDRELKAPKVLAIFRSN